MVPHPLKDSLSKRLKWAGPCATPLPRHSLHGDTGDTAEWNVPAAASGQGFTCTRASAPCVAGEISKLARGRKVTTRQASHANIIFNRQA